jgi:hypothetical protein
MENMKLKVNFENMKELIERIKTNTLTEEDMKLLDYLGELLNNVNQMDKE